MNLGHIKANRRDRTRRSLSENPPAWMRRKAKGPRVLSQPFVPGMYEGKTPAQVQAAIGATISDGHQSQGVRTQTCATRVSSRKTIATAGAALQRTGDTVNPAIAEHPRRHGKILGPERR